MLHKPKILISSKGLGLPNTLKKYFYPTNDTLLLEETWQEMDSPWKQGDIIIAQEGYKWISTWKIGANYVKTEMYNRNDALIGTYYDICDKVTRKNNEFSFTDWYLDVWKPNQGVSQLLDEDELQGAVNEGYLTQEQAKVAQLTAQTLL